MCKKVIHLIIFCVRFENQGHQERKNDCRRDARACRCKGARERPIEPFLRTPHGAVCQKIAESRNGDRCARACPTGAISLHHPLMNQTRWVEKASLLKHREEET